MKHYKIFEHPTGKIEAVKLGWSWPAFFFDCIWALFKKMWWLGGCIFAIFVLVEALLSMGDEALYELGIFAAIILRVIFGLNGNRWRENKLQSRGYHYKETKTAANPEGATALYLQQKSPSAVEASLAQ